MPTVKMKVESSVDSLARLSRDNPKRKFRTLGWHAADAEGVLVLLEAPGLTEPEVAPYLDEDSDVLDFHVVHEDEQAVYIRLHVPEPAPYRAGIESGNVPQTVLTFGDGWIHTEMTTSMERVQEFLASLREADVRYEITALTQSGDENSLLTERQQTIIETAVSHGYYDQPRACTLEELADSLGVHRSTVGDVLNRAESRIITSFVGGFDQ